MSSFPYFEVSGTPQQIGTASGDLFGDLILANYNFYEEFLAEVTNSSKSNFKDRLKEEANSFAETVEKLFPDYHLEIQAIAAASKLETWQIYALNARTEIFRRLAIANASKVPDVGECTSLYFPDSKVLGQNWDWHPKLEELCVVLKVSPDNKPSFVMLTEPGIIGKIGVNSLGVGVCLNILFADCKITGVPVHIMLRAILESSSTKEAKALIEKLPRGTTSNLLIADSAGNAVDLELIGDQIINASLISGELIHTNHFIDKNSSTAEPVPGSLPRLETAAQLYKTFSNQGAQGMKEILSDRSHPEFPICRNYAMGSTFMVGTVAAVVLDLQSSELQVAKGQPTINSVWSSYKSS